MFVLVGLGNPGERYALNRHNIGFMVIDSLAAAYGFPAFKVKFSAAVSEGTIGKHKVILCKPMAYMNLSGQPVRDLLHFYKASPGYVYAIHDDLDLAPGRIKVKRGGGNGGHNGLRSLDQHIGKDYWRVRIGIGHPGRPPAHADSVARYVLSNFSRTDEAWLKELLSAITEEAEGLFEGAPGAWPTKIAQRRNP